LSIVVQPGDCLSRICSKQLSEKGNAVSQREIYAAVKEVAKANHIADPNKIYTGQALDMSVLAPSASPTGTLKAVAVPEGPKQWQSLVTGAVSLSSGFGLRKDPFTGQVDRHDGIDVVAPAGAPVRAFAAGSVVFSGWKSGYGNTVVLRHGDGLESVYSHVSKSLVHVGEQVACHSPIGCVGSTGRSTGAHLHFEVRRNGKAVDPIPLLS
jgi:murein DD-endopeptidase MepM/ murein hydrolase activator NlpD